MSIYVHHVINGKKPLQHLVNAVLFKSELKIRHNNQHSCTASSKL